uniref:Uncharacterized protein n=1 Tax=Rousettus aegyptiacus TaxID=9407 RepID=A0A7J8BDT5_ROUAE|nr:hypothetical protein HJG63_009681 [Rousettus aegyptiacus]
MAVRRKERLGLAPAHPDLPAGPESSSQPEGQSRRLSLTLGSSGRALPPQQLIPTFGQLSRQGVLGPVELDRLPLPCSCFQAATHQVESTSKSTQRRFCKLCCYSTSHPKVLLLPYFGCFGNFSSLGIRLK